MPQAAQVAVWLLGARRALGGHKLRRRLELAGLSWEDLVPTLARVRTISDWARAFERDAAKSEARGDWERAAKQAFLGQLLLAPAQPLKAELLQTLRRCHVRDRRDRLGLRTTPVTLHGLAGLWETPGTPTRPPVLLMPPLASVKEELTALADPLLRAGHSVLRLELPGQGESPAPLRSDLDARLRACLDEMGWTAQTGVFAGGISLGAFFALRLAGIDNQRVRAAFGVSPPAFTTPDDWARQPEVIWQYLDIYFGGATRQETYENALRLHMDDLRDNFTGPVLLYHGIRDRINPPDVPRRWRHALPYARLTEVLLPDGHACLGHLRSRIGPESARWLAAIPI